MREVDAAQKRRMLEAFLEAAQSGDMVELEKLFTDDEGRTDESHAPTAGVE